MGLFSTCVIFLLQSLYVTLKTYLRIFPPKRDPWFFSTFPFTVSETLDVFLDLVSPTFFSTSIRFGSLLVYFPSFPMLYCQIVSLTVSFKPTKVYFSILKTSSYDVASGNDERLLSATEKTVHGPSGPWPNGLICSHRSHVKGPTTCLLLRNRKDPKRDRTTLLCMFWT